MTEIDLQQAIADLDRVFHHEGDFQHALAWHLHQQYSDARLRLERRFTGAEFPGTANSVYIDIWIERGGVTVPIELKYKPDIFRGDWGDESFDIRRHSAQDVSRFDFVKDIARIETVLNQSESECGAVVLLTNDHLYWQSPTRDNVVDYEFRIHDGKVLEGTLSWSEDAGSGTVGQNRNHPIELNGTYKLHWQDYEYNIPSEAEGSVDYRYLLVKIEDS